MKLGRFIGGMIFVLCVVGLWSWQESAAFSTIVLRLIVCAAIMQLGYFAGVAIAVFRADRQERAAKTPERESREPAEHPARRTPHG